MTAGHAGYLPNSELRKRGSKTGFLKPRRFNKDKIPFAISDRPTASNIGIVNAGCTSI